MDGLSEVRPIRFPRFWFWIPFATNVAGPPVPAIVGGLTVLVTGVRLRHTRTGRRVATLVSGPALLGLAVFQATPMGAVFTAWVTG
jgi:ribose/xylose/arabinose/galactoside ABC-type transport system permease subunit